MSSTTSEISSELAWASTRSTVCFATSSCAPPTTSTGCRRAHSQATLDSGARFDRDLALQQHQEMVACYQQEGVACHFLKPDPALPYQVFARDSSTGSPAGGIVLAPQQSWRRGEHAAVTDFYTSAGIPLAGTITAAAVEGGDVMIVEPGCVLIGCGETRTQDQGARQLAALFGEMGWEARVSRSLRATSTSTSCTRRSETSWAPFARPPPRPASSAGCEARGSTSSRFPTMRPSRSASTPCRSAPIECFRAPTKTLNAALRARGVTVLDPALSMFTAGGGGAHCMGQALRRERCA